jgi:hypothetical protein
MKLKFLSIPVLTVVLALSACDNATQQGGETSEETTTTTEVVEEIDPMEDKGIGPVTSLELGAEIDDVLVAKGKEIFDTKCSACHKVEKRYIGPSPTGIMDRRTPEWIMNMILNPDEMVAQNAQAKQLLAEYSSPMANQNLTEEEARNVLEYFRTLK